MPNHPFGGLLPDLLTEVLPGLTRDSQKRHVLIQSFQSLVPVLDHFMVSSRLLD
jgi:hypothetical protein